jgi:hypothetical protein
MQKTLIAAIFYFVASVAFAVEVQFVQTGIGSGIVGTTSFRNATFTITSIGDTSNRFLIPAFQNGFCIPNDSSSIAIDSMGTFQVLSGTTIFVDNADSLVGYSCSHGTHWGRCREESWRLSEDDYTNGRTRATYRRRGYPAIGIGNGTRSAAKLSEVFA